MAFKDIENKREYENRRYKENPEYFKANTRKWRIKNRIWFMWNAARSRSEKKGIPFDIEISDIIIPETCPILKIKLNHENIKIQDSSPSLDRIDPRLGYTKGNIQVISNKANTMKSNATAEELKLFSKWVMNTFK